MMSARGLQLRAARRTWIRWRRRKSGKLPKSKWQEWIFREAFLLRLVYSRLLIHLDLAENSNLSGNIPDEVYTLTRLKNLYLHNCDLTGTLSEGVADLELLEELFLGNNRLTGTIPSGLASPQRGTRPLRKLTARVSVVWSGTIFLTLAPFPPRTTGKIALHHNQIQGSIPENLNLPDLVYLDLSFNNFDSTIPSDLASDATSLRQLYLDHNNFTATIPESLSISGTSALVTLDLSSNMLTGGFPTSWADKDAISTTDTINVENNMLTENVDKEICDLSIFEQGQIVEFSADCDICRCRPLCDQCRERSSNR